MTEPASEQEAPKPEEERELQRHETRHAALQLVLVIVAALVASFATGVTKTLFVLVAVIIMVMVHEFGHFVTAKWAGMKVTEYFLGFGPRLWSFRKGETEYGVRAIPAGGFVRVIGMNNLEDVDPSEETRSFRSSPTWRKVIMASAGSFMHFVMAFLISFTLLTFVGTPTDKGTQIGTMVDLQSQSPAKAAGLQVGDEIISINHQPVSNWTQILDDLSKAQIGQPTPVTIQRNGNPLDLVLTPIDRRDALQADGSHVSNTDPNVAKPFVGIGAKLQYETVGPVDATTKSVSILGHGTVAVFKAFGHMFSPSGLKLYYQNVTGHVPEGKQTQADENRFVSPVGLVSYANDAAKAGWFAVLSLLFSINLFVGIFNMFPLLPFDGGHVAIALYERVRSIKRPRYHADYAKLVPLSYAVILVLALIAGTSLWLDITNPLPNQFK